MTAVTVTLISGLTQTLTIPAAEKNATLIGLNWQMSAITITGIAVGTYTVRFSQ